jgi:DNA-binding transcriptional regulator YdaS (Cro superfamily)
MVESSPEAEGLRAAVTAYGSQSAMAKALGVTQPTISYWLRVGRPLPAELCRDVSKETEIPMARLRPDLFSDDVSSPSLDDGSVTEGAAVVLSDRRAKLDRSTPAPRGDA